MEELQVDATLEAPLSVQDQAMFQRVWQRVMADRPQEPVPPQPVPLPVPVPSPPPLRRRRAHWGRDPWNTPDCCGSG